MCSASCEIVMRHPLLDSELWLENVVLSEMSHARVCVTVVRLDCVYCVTSKALRSMIARYNNGGQN